MAELSATMDVHEFALWRALDRVEAEQASTEEAPVLATPEPEGSRPTAQRVVAFMRRHGFGGD